MAVDRTALNREAELLEKAKWLANLRWVAIAWMAYVAIVSARAELPIFNLGASLVIITALAALNVVWLFAIPRSQWRQRIGLRSRRISLLINVQVALDTVVYAVGVHLSGGMQSVFLIFFPFYISFVGMLLPRRTVWYHTAWTIILVSGLSALEFYGFVPPGPLAQVVRTVVGIKGELTWGSMVLFSAILCIAAFSSNYVAAQLERRREDESRLYKEIERQFIRQNLLSAVAKEISQPLDLSGMMVRVLALAQCAVPFDLASLYLVEKDGTLRRVAQTGDLRQAFVPAETIEGYSFKVISSNKALVINESRFGSSRERGVSLLVVPFSVEGRVEGSIVVQTSSEPGFSDDDLNVFTTLADQVAVAVDNSQLYGQVQETFVSTIAALAAAIDAKDRYTHGHSQHVAEYAQTIAETLKLSSDEVRAIRYAALLHDIGKIGISEAILNKEGRLVQIEQEVMQLHPLLGANILKPIPFLSSVIPFVLHHHETYDGRGYPSGLAGEEIPLGARILAVADAFEAMTSGRPYRSEMDVEDALAELWRCAGRQFDAKVVETFLRIMTNNPELAERAKRNKGYGRPTDKAAPQRSRLLQRVISEKRA